MTKAKLVAVSVRREYDRLAREIIAGTLGEMSDDLDGRYARSLAAFAKALTRAPYAGARHSFTPAQRAEVLAAAGEQLLTARQHLLHIAHALRTAAADVQPGARNVA